MILVEVANYYHRVGTLGYSLNLGNQEYIQKKHISYIQEEMIVFGLILMVGFYNLILFLLRKDQKAAFWFSLFCLSIALRILLVSRFFQYQYPNADHFDLLLRLEYFTFSTSSIFMVFYIQNLMKSQVNRVFRNVSVLYCLFITLIVFLTPTELFSNYLLAVMLCAILVIVFGLYELLRKLNSTDPELRLLSRSVILVFLVFSIIVIHDILMSLGVFQSIDLAGIGLGIFTFGQGVVIAINNSLAWKKSEELSKELYTTNQNLDKLVLDRTKSLEEALQLKQRDLNLAKKIQSSILPLLPPDQQRL